jgi:hypothetical protein
MRHSLRPTLALIVSFMSNSLSAADSAPAEPLRELDRYAFDYAYAGSQLKDHIYERSRRAFAAGDAQRDALKTPDDIRRRQEEVRRNFIASLGGLPASDSPLNARVTGTVQGNGFTIEKIIFEARPRHYVTANLYLPAQRSGRSAAVLFLCGHHTAAKQQPEYQAVCLSLVQAGLIVLAQDPVGQGERLSYYDVATQKPLVAANTRDHDTAGAQCRFLGEGIARYFVHDAMRGIDYLMSRPEVDPARIGVTGNSGGGTQTSAVMLADPRIAAAAPATFIMNRDTYQRTGQPQDAEQIWSGFTRHGYDHEDILLAVAPKPVCVLAVTSDFFPIEGTRRTVERSKRIWETFGQGPALRLVEDDSTHSYTPKLARAAAQFFAKHLLGRDVDLANFTPQPFPMEQLAATKSGQVRAEFADAEFVFDATAATLKRVEKERTARKPQGIAWLREQVMRDREQNALNPRRVERGRKVGVFDVDTAFWWSQPNLANVGMLIRARGATGARPVTIAIWDDGTAAMSKHAAWIRAETGRGRAVFVVNLSGMGPLKPDILNTRPMGQFYDSWHKLSDDLDFLGDSLVALRTFEVLRALEVLGQWPDLARDDVRIHADGRMGVHGKLAAPLDSRVKGCEWTNAFRYSDYVRTRIYDFADVKTLVLPGVLRHFDVDEL